MQMARLIVFWEEACRHRERGMSDLVDTVDVTLGPMRRNVVLGKGWGVPAITNDGLTIAKIKLSDPLDKLGEALATASMPPAVATST
jgi:chaperonin GroEL